MSNINTLLLLVLTFAFISVIIFINHELTVIPSSSETPKWITQLKTIKNRLQTIPIPPIPSAPVDLIKITRAPITSITINKNYETVIKQPKISSKAPPPIIKSKPKISTKSPVATVVEIVEPASEPEPVLIEHKLDLNNNNKHKPEEDNNTINDDSAKFKEGEKEKKGLLKCNGKYIDSEIIYWKQVKGDTHYESPITPHHGYVSYTGKLYETLLLYNLIYFYTHMCIY